MITTGATLRANFAVQIREEFAQCLLQTGQAAESQKWMIEAAELRTQNGLNRNALLAGQVQRESGQRVVEGEIKAQEKTSTDDPSYWRERALYYRGRSQPQQEEEALQKGLALVEPDKQPRSAGPRGRTNWRNQLLSDYVQFFVRQKRMPEAFKLLRTELTEAPAAADSAVTSARMLAFDLAHPIDVNDEVLWKWLGNRPQWDHVEERLLWQMLARAEQNDLERHLIRAEQLAMTGDATRAKVLGWIENRMQLARRSLPLLKHAVANLTDENQRNSAGFTLFESYLDTADWQRAESTWPIARRQLTAWEIPVWYSKIAVIAAKDGKTTDAMRIWDRVANMDLTCTGPVAELIDAGLRKELTEFYQSMQRAIPASEIPAQQLAQLRPPKS